MGVGKKSGNRWQWAANVWKCVGVGRSGWERVVVSGSE